MQAGKVTLMCGGRKCCPVLETRSDGSVVLHDTDDGRDQHVTLDPEQALLLFNVLGHALGK